MRSSPAFHVANRIFTVSSIYDWLLTLPDEIRVIRSGKTTGAQVLFLLNRYLWIAGNIVQVMFDQWVEPSNAVSAPASTYYMPTDLN